MARGSEPTRIGGEFFLLFHVDNFIFSPSAGTDCVYRGTSGQFVAVVVLK